MKRRALYGMVSTFWVLTIVVIPSYVAGAILCVGGITSTVALITHEAKRNHKLGWARGYHSNTLNSPNLLTESELLGEFDKLNTSQKES